MFLYNIVNIDYAQAIYIIDNNLYIHEAHKKFDNV